MKYSSLSRVSPYPANRPPFAVGTRTPSDPQEPLGLRSRAHALSAALGDAVSDLEALIAEGIEYPDAQYKVSRKHNVPYQLVQALYDRQYTHAQ